MKKAVYRLSKYRNILLNLYNDFNIKRINSKELSKFVEVSSSQVRRDLAAINIKGKPKNGYSVVYIIKKLNNILSKDIIHNVIIAGFGDLGRALVKYRNIKTNGFNISAVFDIDPYKTNDKSSPPVFILDKMNNFIKKNKIKLGIITVPKNSAQFVADIMINSGIQGILNFAPIQINIKPEKKILVNNINLELSLENLVYFIQNGTI